MVSPFIDVVTSKKIIFLYAADPKEMVESFAPEVRVLTQHACWLHVGAHAL